MAAVYVDDRRNRKQLEIFGWRLLESFFIFLVKVNFYLGIALNSSFRFHMSLCGLRKEANGVYIAYTASYGIIVCVALWRFINTKAKTRQAFIAHGARSCPEGLGYHLKQEYFSLFLCIGGIISVLGSVSLGFIGVLQHIYPPQSLIGKCANGTKNISYGIIVYAALFAQIATMTIYGFGPHEGEVLVL